ADKYSIPVVVDETIGSFCNIDVTPVSDVVITSTTKAVSGYANVMGGSIVLPPTSPFHTPLKSTLTTQFRNEYFHADAVKLLANSRDYFARSATLNANALALATFLHSYTQPRLETPSLPALVKAVLYPPFTDTHAHYQAMMRQPFAQPLQQQQPPTDPQQHPTESQTPTNAIKFTPGHGCLLALDFPTLQTAKSFYNHLSVHHGPHLGAHRTLAFPFNDAIWGTADPEAAEYLKTFGANPEQVRISVGLEPVGELIEAFGAALEVAGGVLREELGGKVEAE
ncbi:pyridoxal phosphate-dependent transferase, partial [Dichotomopilus funicola]